MTHRPDVLAAQYLAGELAEPAGQSFEDHLIDCDQCWAEVEAGRRGQTAVESLRELAPPHLRAAIRRSVGTDQEQPLRERRLIVWIAAALAVVAGIATAGVVVTRPRPEPAVIASAVAGYTEGRLPGSDMPKAPAPDLQAIRMTEVGAGAGRIDDALVTAYAYRDSVGRRLMVYTSTKAFQLPSDAHMLEGADGPWMTHRDGLMLLGSRDPHTLLIVGEDDELVHDAAVVLDVM